MISSWVKFVVAPILLVGSVLVVVYAVIGKKAEHREQLEVTFLKCDPRYLTLLLQIIQSGEWMSLL